MAGCRLGLLDRPAKSNPQRLWPGWLPWLALITAGIVLLRLPSFFEPPWHTDEGIFAAVAQKIIGGGKLYRDAWESKPPLFLYLYVALFKVFGPGVFGLRLAATASAVGTHIAVFFIARRFMSQNRALLATAICGVMLGVPFWEGELALTEIFTILPTALAVLIILRWDERAGGSIRRFDPWLVIAGVMFGAAFLLRQTSLAAAAGIGIWLLLRGRPWLRAGTLCGAAFLGVVVPVVATFELTGDFHWFWDANVSFFFKYVPSGQQLPFATRPVIVLPFAITVAALLLARLRGWETPKWSLPALWLTLTLAGALLTGRPYSHYFLQAFLPFSMLVAMALPAPDLSWRPSLRLAPAGLLVAALLFEWVYVVMPMFYGDVFAMHWTQGADYYGNFAEFAAGKRSRAEFNDWFDKRVAKTAVVEQALRQLNAEGQKVYIWGEYPWLYPLAGLQPTTRYMTSFYVLLLPYLDVNLSASLNAEKPRYILVMSDAKPKMEPSSIIDQRWNIATKGLEAVLARDYQLVSTAGPARIYRRLPERNGPAPAIGVVVEQAPEPDAPPYP
jgi:hypothetical protein